MITFSSQRGGGQDLATHILNAYDNEIVELADLRGAVAQDLHGAFKEWEVQAETLTRCEKYLFSLSINPDPRQGPLTRGQYMDYIRRAEEALGLGDQPRGIVFHIKYGREHCHVAWSRIDAENKKAVHIAFDHEKLMTVTRAFARDHGLTLPKGYEKSRQVGQVSLYEQEQLRQTGFSKADHKRQVTEAWQQSDNAQSFVHALAERGYILATGKRPYILVDLYGNTNALPKLIDDKAIRTEDVRAFLKKDYPVESLPTVEEAVQLVAAHRKLVERSLNADHYATGLADLKHSHKERRASFERERDALAQRQHQVRLDQQREHKAQRDGLRQGHMRVLRNIKAERHRDAPTGLAAFLGRISGVELIRKALHRYEDGKRLKVYREHRAELKTRHKEQVRALDLRLGLQAKEVGRKLDALDKVERRELASFMRDQRAEQRVRDRGDDDGLPSLREVSERQEGDEAQSPDLLRTFLRTKALQQEDAPDLLRATRRAASHEATRDQRGKVDAPKPDGKRRDDGHDPDRSRD